MKIKLENRRIVICINCGCLYDIHYIDNVKYEKKVITKFECKNCGMMPVVKSRFLYIDK